MGYKNYDELEITVSIKDMVMRICLKWETDAGMGNCIGRFI